ASVAMALARSRLAPRCPGFGPKATGRLGAERVPCSAPDSTRLLRSQLSAAHEIERCLRNLEKCVSAAFRLRRANGATIWPAHAKNSRVSTRRRLTRMPYEALAFAQWFGAETLKGSQ